MGLNTHKDKELYFALIQLQVLQDNQSTPKPNLTSTQQQQRPPLASQMWSEQSHTLPPPSRRARRGVGLVCWTTGHPVLLMGNDQETEPHQEPHTAAVIQEHEGESFCLCSGLKDTDVNPKLL